MGEVLASGQQRLLCLLTGSIFFLIILVVLGCNLTVERLGEIVGQEIQPFFYAEVLESDIFLDFSGNEYQLDLTKVEKSREKMNVYIQKSWVNVKLILAPRINYLNDVWQQGVNKLKEDVGSVIQLTQ